MDEKKQIGLRLRELRKKRGYSQEKLAEIIGINAKYLSSIERGAENPTLDLFIRLAHGLRLDIQDIFDIENEARHAKALRRRLKSLLDNIQDEQLVQVLRLIKVVVR